MDAITIEKHLNELGGKHGEAIKAVLSDFGYNGDMTVLALLAVHQKYGTEFTKALDEETDPKIGFEKLLIEAKKVLVKTPENETESFKGKDGEEKKFPLIFKLAIASALVLLIIYFVRK
ncbi:MAG: hypothetical protein AAFQ94_09185 [Bacteroidota bacterium]